MKTNEKLSLSDLLERTLSGKRVEPQQRLVGGRYGWAIHRYPIRGGLTVAEVLAKNIANNNQLFQRLISKRQS